MEKLSLFLSIGALICMTVPSLLKGKNMKGILVLLCLGNAIMGTNYLMSGGLNGAVSSYNGVVTTAINFSFQVKGKTVPKFLITIYLIISIILNLWVSKGISIGLILMIGASVAYQLGCAGKSGATYRFWILINLLLWCVYDIISLTIGALLTHGIQLAIHIIGMLIYDRQSKSITAK